MLVSVLGWLCVAAVAGDEELPYARQIAADLEAYRLSGVTKEMVDGAYCLGGAGFRVQILNNTLWFAGETASFQSRGLSVKMMLYTLSQMYKLPDSDFVVSLHDFPPDGTRGNALPVFAMGKTDDHRVILFPDHTFWNWHEARTKGWAKTSASIRQASSQLKWEEKLGKALFSGAPTSPVRAAISKEAQSRPDLFKVRIHEIKPEHFITLEDHCKHKYLLHLPGITYSARLKYLLACNSVVVSPHLGKSGSQQPGGWYEFYYSGLRAGVHYIDSGNDTTAALLRLRAAPAGDPGDPGGRAKAEAEAAGETEAKAIAAAARAFVDEHLSMRDVYAYWDRLLREYSALLAYAPARHPLPGAQSFGDSLATPQVTHVVDRCPAAERGEL